MLTVWHTKFPFQWLNDVAWFALALPLLIAYPIATTEWASTDTFVFIVAYMSGYANTSIGCCTNAIGAIIDADGITTCKYVCIAFVTLTTNLNFTHI